MFKFKKILASLLAIAMMASVGTSVMANEDSESMDGISRRLVNSRGESPISTFEGASGNRIGTRAVYDGVTFIHDNGFEFRGPAGKHDERVWGETSHVKDGIGVDGYTRARYEKGGEYKADSGRVWDHADGTIDGHSKAVSGWVESNLNFYTGHTYYGH